MTDRTYENTSKVIMEGLKKNKEFYSDSYYVDFTSRIKKIKEKINESKKEGRLLKIGIVGEVKAGKSSFLNALIFDGEDILPKASTPMTAALTRIIFSERSEAKIVFYKKNDWETIRTMSSQYDKIVENRYKEYLKNLERQEEKLKNSIEYIPRRKPSLQEFKKEFRGQLEKEISKKYRACKELVGLAEKKINKGILDKLDTEEIVKVENLKEELEKYIGADGDYTPIVKHVELRINQENLKDIEIIDTPGLNDPVISRGETTKDFLGNCDVIFLLSYCGQFLSQEDISFICETLPREGVKETVIIGSKFDSGLLDCNKTKELKDAFLISQKTYNEQAKDNLEKSLVSNNYNNDNLLKIKDSLPPIYTSSILFNCAIKNKNNLDYSEEEKHILKNLGRFNGFEPNNYKQLLGLSGIIDVGKKLKIIKNNKENIIKEKNEEIITVEKGNLLKLLEDINLNVLSNRNDIEKYNKEELENRLLNITYNLNSVRRKISNIFELSIIESKKRFISIENELEKEETNKKYLNFNVKTRKEEHHRTYNSGLFGWTKNHYIETIIISTVNISEAIFKIKQYLVKCKEYSEMEFKKIVNKEELKKIIKKEITKLFDLSDKNLDEEKIVRPVEIVIEKILIPDLNIDEKEFIDMIINSFSGRDVLEGDEISTLERMQLETLGRVFSKVKEKIRKYEVELEKILKEQSSIFVDNLEKEIKENTEKLKEQLKDKEKSLENYGKFIEEIKLYKKMIMEMEL
jgi:hypothetical protein